MRKYEYHVESFSSLNFQQKIARMNALGAEGWKLIGVERGYIFMRATA